MFIASASGDKTVRVWDAATGTNLRIFQTQSHSVFSVAFSPDGKFIEAESLDKTLQVWDVATGNAVDNSHAVPIPLLADSFVVEDDGWVHRGEESSRRVCWLPAYSRPKVQCSKPDRLVIATANSRVIFLDFSACTL
jgi:WD40 repeat protein